MRPTIIHTDAMDWAPSPSPTVWRKRLELSGPTEAGRVTSVVRYDPDSRFAAHPHPEGEEIVVLSGVFSDEHGDYPAGTYLLNPEGFEHAPRSEPGCTLFVKLRQYPGLQRPQVQVDTRSQPWQAHAINGVQWMPLFADDRWPDSMHLLKIDAQATIGAQVLERGEERFVLEGSFGDEYGRYRVGSWVRYPPGCTHTPVSDQGCVLYVKKGHL